MTVQSGNGTVKIGYGSFTLVVERYDDPFQVIKQVTELFSMLVKDNPHFGADPVAMNFDAPPDLPPSPPTGPKPETKVETPVAAPAPIPAPTPVQQAQPQPQPAAPDKGNFWTNEYKAKVSDDTETTVKERTKDSETAEVVETETEAFIEDPAPLDAAPEPETVKPKVTHQAFRDLSATSHEKTTLVNPKPFYRKSEWADLTIGEDAATSDSESETHDKVVFKNVPKSEEIGLKAVKSEDKSKLPEALNFPFKRFFSNDSNNL